MLHVIKCGLRQPTILYYVWWIHSEITITSYGGAVHPTTSYCLTMYRIYIVAVLCITPTSTGWPGTAHAKLLRQSLYDLLSQQSTVLIALHRRRRQTTAASKRDGFQKINMGMFII